MKHATRKVKMLLLSGVVQGALLLGSSAVLADAKPKTMVVDPVLGDQSKVSVWSYTKAFAQRFKLPDMVDEGLPVDVWAMEFRILKNDVTPGYRCQLHVYLNNNLKILYPEGEVGSVETLNIGGRFPQGGGIAKSEDRVFHGEQAGKYHTKAAFVNSGKTGYSTGIHFHQYRKYFVSNVAYLSFSLAGCQMITNPSSDAESFLWVEKETGRDYRQRAQFDPNDFYQFQIPKSLSKRFYSYARLAAEKNNTYFSAQDKVHREQRGRTGGNVNQK